MDTQKILEMIEQQKVNAAELNRFVTDRQRADALTIWQKMGGTEAGFAKVSPAHFLSIKQAQQALFVKAIEGELPISQEAPL